MKRLLALFCAALILALSAKNSCTTSAAEGDPNRRAPDPGLILTVIEHAREMNFSDDQKKQFETFATEFRSRRQSIEKDPQVTELYQKLRAADRKVNCRHSAAHSGAISSASDSDRSA